MRNILTIRNILRSIVTLLAIINGIILVLLNMKFPILNSEEISLINFVFKVICIILFLLGIAIIIYIIEHKISNKNEAILNEEEIPEKFDTDLIREKDILYLSTILNQKYPNKKEVVLLIMQLINKRVIDLSMTFDGEKHDYFIEKRNNTNYTVNEIEAELLNYVFKNSNKVDLIETIESIYRKRDCNHILKQCKKYIERHVDAYESQITPIYKIITVTISLLLLFLLFFATFLPSTTILTEIKNISQIDVILFVIMIAILGLSVNFVCLMLLKRVTMKYQYDNDSYLWIVRIIYIFESLLIISYAFPKHEIIQYISFMTYILALLTIMIKYNTHISLNKEQVNLREELIAIKNYLIKMDYLSDKEFGNIITYEEYITYGFLFDITIKINSEFDIIQKELKSALENESKSYWNVLKETI